jgi:hypothetical protein
VAVSTATWSRFTSLPAGTSLATALEAVNDIPDPDIQTLERIAVANGLLGTTADVEMIAVKTKEKNGFMGMPD